MNLIGCLLNLTNKMIENLIRGRHDSLTNVSLAVGNEDRPPTCTLGSSETGEITHFISYFTPSCSSPFPIRTHEDLGPHAQ